MAERQKLSDILRGAALDDLAKTWDSTEAADDHAPIPAGSYRCGLVDGTAFESKSGTAGYKLTLEVLDGDHARRRLWYDIWLSSKSMPIAKRELAKLGITSAAQLDDPLPEGFVVAAKVVLQTGDDGRTFNKVRSFDVIAVEPPKPDPFAPGETDEREVFEL